MPVKKRLVYPLSLGETDLASLEKISSKTGASKAQAIREAIKAYADELEGLEVIKLRSISKHQARKEILEYLKGHDRALTSDIADSLKLDIVFVNGILEELWGEKKVEQRTKRD
ncbi:MAG: ribbon-helix-helix protein, CopG family [Nitrososphaerota archaeon]|nr:ribbon-helix-helix protein, CopG family [Nitrososphaerota archaeon]